jgi:hypothetical protein
LLRLAPTLGIPAEEGFSASGWRMTASGTLTEVSPAAPPP